MTVVNRICQYRHCDVDLDEAQKRPQAKYCNKGHKDAERHARRRDAAGSTPEGSKPRKSAHTPRRRLNRRGHGTRLYVFDEDLALVRQLLGTRQACRSDRSAPLLSKVIAAERRLDRGRTQ